MTKRYWQSSRLAPILIWYDLAKPGTMRLVPPKHNLDKLRDDYEHMQNMLFGDRPEFDDVLVGIEKLEKEINILS